MGGKRDVYKYLGGTMEIVFKQMINEKGFNALMSGIRSRDGKFLYSGERTDFWSSSPSHVGQYFYLLNSKKDAKKQGLFDSKEGTAGIASEQDDANGGKSVRLFKD